MKRFYGKLRKLKLIKDVSILHIKITLSNIFITLTNIYGDVICTMSSGQLNKDNKINNSYKKKKKLNRRLKSSFFFGKLLIGNMADFCKQLKLRVFYIFFSNYKKNLSKYLFDLFIVSGEYDLRKNYKRKKRYYRNELDNFFIILGFLSEFKIAHNGCRGKKSKRK